MKMKPYVRASYLDGFQALVLSRGGRPAELLKAAGLCAIPGDSHRHLIALDKFFYLLEYSARALECPELGLELARHQDTVIFGPLSRRLADCGNLAQALDVVVEYLQVQVVGIDLRVEKKEDSVKIVMSSPLGAVTLGTQYQSYVLAILYTTLRVIMKDRCILRAAYFPMSEPANANDYSRMFQCPIAFQQSELAITMDSQLLAQPVGDMSQLLAEKIQTIMSDCSEQEFMTQVEKVMASYIISGRCVVADIAAYFCCSERTLQRRLQHNGSSFYKMLNAVKARLAQQFLNHTCYRLTDIALMLGYKQLSSFSRSYYRWYGEAPSRVERGEYLGQEPLEIRLGAQLAEH